MGGGGSSLRSRWAASSISEPGLDRGRKIVHLGDELLALVLNLSVVGLELLLLGLEDLLLLFDSPELLGELAVGIPRILELGLQGGLLRL